MTHLLAKHDSSKDSDYPLLSIIIPFFVDKYDRHIHQRVWELLDTNFPEFVEVIMVDSTKTASLASKYKYKCDKKNFLYVASHQGKHYSLGKARNDAAVRASGHYLFFMDIDFIYSNIFWEALTKIIKNEFQTGELHKFLILPCLYLNEKTTNNLGNNRDWREFQKIRDSVLQGENTYVSTIAMVSSTIIINRKYFLWMGGFREDYFGHGCEEFDFIHRLSLNYPLAVRADDYYHDDVQKFPAHYKGFRSHFLYYSLPYFFEPIFLLHRYHSRSLLNKFYQKRKKNEMKLQLHMKKYDEGVCLPSLQSLQSENGALALHLGNHRQEPLPPISIFIKSLQMSYGFHDDKYCGLFFYKNGVSVESGSLLRKVRKLFRKPKKFLVDMKIFKKIPAPLVSRGWLRGHAERFGH